MKTGGVATRYEGGRFADYETSYDSFCDSLRYSGESEDDFEELRYEVDSVATKNCLPVKEAEETWESIKCLFHC